MNVHCSSKYVVTIDQVFGMKLQSKMNYFKMNFSYSRIRKIGNGTTPPGGNDKRCKDFFSFLISEIILQELKLSSSQVTQGRSRLFKPLSTKTA